MSDKLASITLNDIVLYNKNVYKLDTMTLNEIILKKFRKVIWKLLRGFLGPLGGLLGASWDILGASWRPLGGLLGTSWGPFVRHHFETLEISGRAVLKPSWGRFLSFFRPFWSYFWRLFGYYRHSKFNMQNQRFTSILTTSAWFFQIFGRSKTLKGMAFLALEGHFDCIFTVKS